MITLNFDPTDQAQVKAAHAATTGLMSQFESQPVGQILLKAADKTKAELEEPECEAEAPGPVDNSPVNGVAVDVRKETEEEEAARKRSEAAKKAAETRRKNKEAAEKAEEAEEANADQEAAEAEDASQGVDPATNAVTLDDLRAVLAVKADEHYDAIAGELQRLGAKNMTLLGEKHYAQMLTFLNAL